jgi:hypothetical protein
VVAVGDHNRGNLQENAAGVRIAGAGGELKRLAGGRATPLGASSDKEINEAINRYARGN